MKSLSLAGLLLLLCHGMTLPQSKERLSLDDAVAIATERNPVINGARKDVDAAQGRFWRGIAPPPATLSVGYDYIPTGAGISNFGERSIGVTQSFDFPSTIILRGSSLTSEVSATEADLGTTILSVTLQVKLAYFGVLAKERKVRLAEENLSIADEFERKAGIRYSVGEGTKLEQLTAKVQHTQASNALEIAGNELKAATSELHFALGRGREVSAPAFELSDSLAHRVDVPPLDSLMRRAEHSNPQLRSANFRLSAASVNRTIAWSSILPSFSISYARQTQESSPNLYGVSFGISLPIWFLLDQRGQIQEAAATYARTESDLRARLNSVDLEVRNAYLEYANDERQVQLYTSEWIPQAEEVYRAAAASYQAGEITYIEFLQARQTLISARSTYIDALFQYNAAVAQLEKAIGRPLSE